MFYIKGFFLLLLVHTMKFSFPFLSHAILLNVINVHERIYQHTRVRK